MLSDLQGNTIEDVGKPNDNVVVSVRIVVGGAILDNQLTGMTERAVENGKAVFSGLAVPALTGKEFKLQFVLQDEASGVFLTADSEEFALRPSGLLLNNTLPHTRSGMTAPTLSVRLTDRRGVFVPQEPLPDPQKTVEITFDLLTTRYLGCSRQGPANVTLANWSQCARDSALAGALFFYVGPDALGQSLCGYGGVWSQGCLGDACWHDAPIKTPGCSTAGCARGRTARRYNV